MTGTSGDLSGERFRLYIDESGDHVFKNFEQPHHRYLCLSGIWFKNIDYVDFHTQLEDLKQRHFPHSPDDPVVLHREEIVQARGSFWRLRDTGARAAFDDDLVALISGTRFIHVAVVIDKAQLRESYPTPAHPYHLAMGFLLQRYCGYLNHVGRQGDVMAESRGGLEDRLLKDSYERVHTRGVWMTRAESFQQALTSKQLKLKPKSANIGGLQLSDLLCKPTKNEILAERQRIDWSPTAFEARLLAAARQKLNRHLYDGRIEGYGKVFFPK